jgi:hypothetical protein
MNTFVAFQNAQREAVALQRLEGNPLSEEQLRMFEDFKERGLSNEERDAEIDRWAERKFGVKPRA